MDCNEVSNLFKKIHMNEGWAKFNFDIWCYWLCADQVDLSSKVGCQMGKRHMNKTHSSSFGNVFGEIGMVFV